MSDTYTVFNRKERHNEVKNLIDLQAAIQEREDTEIIKHLNKAIGPRIAQDTFVCGLCGFRENADIVGATNIVKRGVNLIQKILQR